MSQTRGTSAASQMITLERMLAEKEAQIDTLTNTLNWAIESIRDMQFTLNTSMGDALVGDIEKALAQIGIQNYLAFPIQPTDSLKAVYQNDTGSYSTAEAFHAAIIDALRRG